MMHSPRPGTPRGGATRHQPQQPQQEQLTASGIKRELAAREKLIRDKLSSLNTIGLKARQSVNTTKNSKQTTANGLSARSPSLPASSASGGRRSSTPPATRRTSLSLSSASRSQEATSIGNGKGVSSPDLFDSNGTNKSVTPARHGNTAFSYHQARSVTPRNSSSPVTPGNNSYSSSKTCASPATPFVPINNNRSAVKASPSSPTLPLFTSPFAKRMALIHGFHSGGSPVESASPTPTRQHQLTSSHRSQSLQQQEHLQSPSSSSRRSGSKTISPYASNGVAKSRALMELEMANEDEDDAVSASPVEHRATQALRSVSPTATLISRRRQGSPTVPEYYLQRSAERHEQQQLQQNLSTAEKNGEEDDMRQLGTKEIAVEEELKGVDACGDDEDVLAPFDGRDEISPSRGADHHHNDTHGNVHDETATTVGREEATAVVKQAEKLTVTPPRRSMTPPSAARHRLGTLLSPSSPTERSTTPPPSSPVTPRRATTSPNASSTSRRVASHSSPMVSRRSMDAARSATTTGILSTVVEDVLPPTEEPTRSGTPQQVVARRSPSPSCTLSYSTPHLKQRRSATPTATSRRLATTTASASTMTSPHLMAKTKRNNPITLAEDQQRENERKASASPPPRCTPHLTTSYLSQPLFVDEKIGSAAYEVASKDIEKLRQLVLRGDIYFPLREAYTDSHRDHALLLRMALAKIKQMIATTTPHPHGIERRITDWQRWGLKPNDGDLKGLRKLQAPELAKCLQDIVAVLDWLRKMNRANHFLCVYEVCCNADVLVKIAEYPAVAAQLSCKK